MCEPRPVRPRLPILIGGSGRTKTLRTAARYADIWNGYGSPEVIAATSEVLAERCAEISRPFASIERTVTVHAVLRDTVEAADRAWNDVIRRHGLEDDIGSDGSERGLDVRGTPADLATFADAHRQVGVSEIEFVFRDPFDHEMLERIGEVRAALGD